MLKNEFLQVIEKFINKYDMAPSKFGRLSIGCSDLIFNLRNGRECREATQEKVLAFMSTYEAEHGGEVQPNDFYKGE